MTKNKPWTYSFIKDSPLPLGLPEKWTKLKVALNILFLFMAVAFCILGSIALFLIVSS